MRSTLFAGCVLLVGAVNGGSAEKPRVYITESRVTELTVENVSLQKGTSPENIEVMKSFLKNCPEVVVTSNREKADYVVRFDREAPSPATPFVKGNKVAVFDREEDLVFSESARYLTGAVKGTCAAVVKHAAGRK